MRSRIAGVSSGAKPIGSSPIVEQGIVNPPILVQDSTATQQTQIVQGSPVYLDPSAMQMQQQPIFINPQPIMYMNQQQPPIYGVDVN